MAQPLAQYGGGPATAQAVVAAPAAADASSHLSLLSEELLPEPEPPEPRAPPFSRPVGGRRPRDPPRGRTLRFARALSPDRRGAFALPPPSPSFPQAGLRRAPSGMRCLAGTRSRGRGPSRKAGGSRARPAWGRGARRCRPPPRRRASWSRIWTRRRWRQRWLTRSTSLRETVGRRGRRAFSEPCRSRPIGRRPGGGRGRRQHADGPSRGDHGDAAGGAGAGRAGVAAASRGGAICAGGGDGADPSGRPRAGPVLLAVVDGWWRCNRHGRGAAAAAGGQRPGRCRGDGACGGHGRRHECGATSGRRRSLSAWRWRRAAGRAGGRAGGRARGWAGGWTGGWARGWPRAGRRAAVAQPGGGCADGSRHRAEHQAGPARARPRGAPCHVGAGGLEGAVAAEPRPGPPSVRAVAVRRSSLEARHIRLCARGAATRAAEAGRAGDGGEDERDPAGGDRHRGGEGGGGRGRARRVDRRRLRAPRGGGGGLCGERRLRAVTAMRRLAPLQAGAAAARRFRGVAAAAWPPRPVGLRRAPGEREGAAAAPLPNTTFHWSYHRTGQRGGAGEQRHSRSRARALPGGAGGGGPSSASGGGAGSAHGAGFGCASSAVGAGGAGDGIRGGAGSLRNDPGAGGAGDVARRRHQCRPPLLA